MFSINVKRVLTTLSVMLFVWIIFVDPFGLKVIEQNSIPMITEGINKFVNSIRFDYVFSKDEIITGITFLKNLILGILIMWMTSSYTQRLLQNIAIPMFIGLTISVGINYFNNIYGVSGSIYDIVTSFFSIMIGITIFTLIYLIKSRGKAPLGSKYKTSKYKRR